MNERIKLLAEQVARESELYCAVPIDMNKESYQFFAQVFAELIVEECAGIVDNYGRWILYDKLAVKIKKHFGVKE
jgi:hypothetical protein